MPCYLTRTTHADLIREVSYAHSEAPFICSEEYAVAGHSTAEESLQSQIAADEAICFRLARYVSDPWDVESGYGSTYTLLDPIVDDFDNPERADLVRVFELLSDIDSDDIRRAVDCHIFNHSLIGFSII